MALFFKYQQCSISYFQLFVLLLIVSFSCEQFVRSDFEQNDFILARDFSHHLVIKPKFIHGREKRQIPLTKNGVNNAFHADSVSISLETDNGEYVLDLALNKHLLSNTYFAKTQVSGKHKIHRPSREQLDLCHYNGVVKGKHNSWVALSTCDGISGVLFDGSDMYYIENESKANLSEPRHVLYKHEHLLETDKICGFNGSASTLNQFHLSYVNSNDKRRKRNAENLTTVHGPYNSNSESKYVEFVLVVDNSEYKSLGESQTRTENYCKTIANIVNALYAQLNIYIALVGVVIWTENDEIEVVKNGDTTLNAFLAYRESKLNKEHRNDNAQLLTKCQFDKGVVGKALKGPVCTYKFSGGVISDHSPVVGLVATTIAHEMGHNFGMEHDNNDKCTCPDDRCIMAPSTSSVVATHWSSCSVEALVYAIKQGMDHCLKNKPQYLFNGPTCGNGFVEAGEQCDCGLPAFCQSKCCDTSTCTFFPNATCATGTCCDLNTCQLRNAGELCRPVSNECDLPEYCSGESEFCPKDTFKMNTHACNSNEAYCYNGACQSRTNQCKLLWGDTGRSSDKHCYELNQKDVGNSNCGYSMDDKTSIRCNASDVMCGRLHCRHLNERLEFGLQSVANLWNSFLNVNGELIPCRTAAIDLGRNDADPGMVPNGAECGDSRMCVNQKCQSIGDIRSQYNCPEDCNGNGWCNNLRHCHCKDGFGSAVCNEPGIGGSIDSGPSSDPNARKRFIAGMFIVFLGIIPGLSLLTLLVYYVKQNGIKSLFKLRLSPTTVLSSQKSAQRPRDSGPESAVKRSEDNHSLLEKHDTASSASNGPTELFGQFRGFTLRPLQQQRSSNEPTRVAPPPPAPPKITTTSVTTLSDAKPKISSPILKTSTCTAKELISPLKKTNFPVRTAPQPPPPPAQQPAVVSTEEKDHIAVDVFVKADHDDVMVDSSRRRNPSSTLTRIVSMLKPVTSAPTSTVPAVLNTNSSDTLPRQKGSVVRRPHLDRDRLRSVEISNPIPQDEIKIPGGVEALPIVVPANSAAAAAIATTSVKRTQSMKGTTNRVVFRPSIQTFGSMRQRGVVGVKRPVSSIPVGHRPRSPPPPLPSVAQNGHHQYDDCLNTAQITTDTTPAGFVPADNIYDVIDELSDDQLLQVQPNGGGGELLGEIVSEIQSRNVESIYSSTSASTTTSASASALTMKPIVDAVVENTNKIADASDYENVPTVTVYKSPESVYSNTTNSSTTSSGYLQPSAINYPPKQYNSSSASSPSPSGVSTFKGSFARGPLAAAIQHQTNVPSEEEATVKYKSPMVTCSNRPLTNSPDLVTSCSGGGGGGGVVADAKKIDTKPDVLTAGYHKKPIIGSVKPTQTTRNNHQHHVHFKIMTNDEKTSPPKSATINNNNNVNNKRAVVKLKSANSIVDSGKTNTPSGGLKNATAVKKPQTNVAFLQKRFETRTNATPKQQT